MKYSQFLLTLLFFILGADTEPLLRKGYKCDYPHHEITSVVPGDFNGDAYMDLLVTVKTGHHDMNELRVYINWGGSDYLNCTNNFDNDIIIDKIYGEPVAIDFNRDMIIDLFGLNGTKERVFWVFDKSGKPTPIKQAEPGNHNHNNKNNSNRDTAQLTVPHSHAYLDLNNDFTADLFLQTEKGYEIWYGINDDDKKEDFAYSHRNRFPEGYYPHIGQSLFIDMELKGVQNQILPLCLNNDCSNSVIYLIDITKKSNNVHWYDLKVNFKDPQGQLWGYIIPNNELYTRTITARSGDYNMDGYPDLLVTLRLISDDKKFQTFLLENIPCTLCENSIKRTFEVKWYALAPMGNNTIIGTFFDFFQDGILDILLIEKKSNNYRPLAFRNTLDYDANFVKVIVLTGLTHKNDETRLTPLGRKKRVYGTNLPGPRIIYHTTTQDGDPQHGCSVQLPQSAYFSLQLPYTIFGLGRTPNFVDSLTVGLNNRSRTWTQIIPNSQMIVIPNPINDSQYWKAQLFVTPSKLILMSVMALGGTCLFIILIILGFYLKEKREDKQEKLQEAHRFHFDAM